MYDIAGINREIAALEEDRDYQILYWFELGERDRDWKLAPQYSNEWYLMGYEDRDYQLVIGFNPTPITLEQF